jgi:hypothetical protein
MDILFDNRIVRNFTERVVPLLQARGISIAKTDEAAKAWLENWFTPETAIWGASIQVPKIDMIYSCKLHYGNDDKTLAKLFDARVRAYLKSPGKDNSISILVRNTHGIYAYGDAVESIPNQNESITKLLILLSGRGISVLLEPLHEFGCFIVCELWPDEKLPFSIARSRPETPLRVKEYNLSLSFQSWETITFATNCLKCKGDGNLKCERCSGDGSVKCMKCSGDGSIDCKRCSGTGNYTGKYGDVLDCGTCEGDGTLECNNCDGSGKLSCIKCNGTGNIDCYPCHGTGIISIIYQESTNSFALLGKNHDDGTREKDIEISRHKVFLYDFKNNTKVTQHKKQLESIIAEVFEHTAAWDRRKLKIDRFCELITPITKCLEYSRDACGELIRHPIRLSNPKSTDVRLRKKVVYSYSFVHPVPEWLTRRDFPYPLDTPLKIKPVIQLDGELPESAQPALYDIDFEERRLLIQFPVSIDRSKIFGNIEIIPDIPRSSEDTQINYLKRWIDKINHHNPIFESMSLGNRKTSLAKVSLKNLGIEKWISQNTAVETGCGNAPLFLVKGPPGTGKTTVIVEIVQQVVDRGGRVLVCSQTHQAVRNVLERLHKIGNIPMLRYARDEGKLSEIERRYLGGGSEFDHSHIVMKAKSNEDNIRTRVLSIENDFEVLLPAYEKVKKLDEFLKEKEAKRKKAEKQFDDETGKSTSKYNSMLLDIKAKYDSIEIGLSSTVNKLEKQIDETSDLIKKTEVELSKYNHCLQGRNVSTEKGFFSGLADILPIPLATDSSIARRRDKAGNLLKEKRSVEITLKKTKHDSENKLKDTIQEKKRKELEINNSKMTILESICKCRTDILAIIAQESFAGKHEITNKLTASLPIAIKHGIQKDDDFNFENWTKHLAKMKDELTSLKGKLEFCEKWTNDLDDNKEELGAFLNQQVKVIFSTCVGLAGLNKDFGQYKLAQFDLAIVDEAGHATIPETLIPLSFAKRAILIGDEKQLPPIIGNNLPCSPQAKTKTREVCVKSDDSCWLEYSLFEELWTDNALSIPRVMLDTQFRMHPTIAQFVSDNFYEGNLKTGIKGTDRIFTFGEFQQPVCLISTSAYGNERYEVPQGTSWKNPLEAKMVRRVIEHLCDHLKKDPTEHGHTIEVGVISPYSAQTILLRNELEPFLNAHQSLKMSSDDIASVDKYQGSERDIIIASFVRSPRDGQNTSLRFVHDLKRMNVAFSRARKMLILVGDIEALCNNKGDESGKAILKKFHQYVKNRGRILHVWEKRG